MKSKHPFGARIPSRNREHLKIRDGTENSESSSYGTEAESIALHAVDFILRTLHSNKSTVMERKERNFKHRVFFFNEDNEINARALAQK